MIKEAFTYALREVTVPQGRHLWLYGPSQTGAADHYQPWHDGTTQADFADISKLAPAYDAVFAYIPKQREEAQGLIALALQRSKGMVMIAAANDAGGTRLARALEAYGVATQSASKHHCRVVWTMDATKADQQLIAENIAHLAPRELTLEGESYWSVPGLFGWDKIDEGSRLLLAHLPPVLTGRLADFGCGYGYLARALSRQPSVVSIDAIDADARAVAACARYNDPKITPLWHDIRTLPAKRQYDVVVMNPPFHSGKKEDVGLGEQFIRAALANLRQGGRLYFVANRHLPYESVVPNMKILHEDGAYKIITVAAS